MSRHIPRSFWRRSSNSNLTLGISNHTQRRWFNLQLESTQLQTQELCRKFADTELKPVATKIDKTGMFPKKQIKKLGELGLMGAMVDPKYGGSGLDMLSVAVAVEEISRGCASTGVILSIHNCLYANLIQQLGTEEQKLQFLGEFANGTIGCFALSEPNAGSDVANIGTTAVEDGDSWILNGMKSWVTSALEGKAVIIFATIDRTLRHKGLACFIVPMNTPGVHIGKNEGKLGIRAASTCDVVLEDVRIPKANLIGERGEGFKIAMTQLDQARIGISAHAVGISQAALNCAIEYSLKRIAFGKPLARISAVQDRIADMSVLTDSARLLTYRAATNVCTKNSAAAKLAAGKCAAAVSEHCVQILGGMGISTDMPAERHYRDARGTQIYGGVTDVQKMVVAHQIFKEYRRQHNLSC